MSEAYGIIDPDYARVFTIARCTAWSEGYAIVMHGSFTRDLDLLAVPWAERACEPKHLVRRIAHSVGMRFAREEPTQKFHGRLAWTLLFKKFGDPRFVDLSVIPPAPCDRSGEAGETSGLDPQGESTVTGAARQAPSDNPLTETKEGSDAC